MAPSAQSRLFGAIAVYSL